jgi:hypothetical protein
MPSHAELLPRYKELRAKARPIANALAKSLSKDELGDAARRLGMLRGKEILLETEDEMAVLVDLAIFDIRHDGENAVQRFLREKAPAAGTDERLILETKLSARHSIFQVQEAEPGVGVLFRDMLRDVEEFVWDVGFSHTALPGGLIASRLYSPGEITLSTGAALPVYAERVTDLLAKVAPYVDPATGLVDFSDPLKASEIAIAIIADCVKSGASASIRYAETSQSARIARGGAPRLTSTKIGRNDPCPCGSGKKYKKCCGA